MTTRLTPKQIGGSTSSRRERCREVRQDRRPTCKQLRHRDRVGTKPIGRRAIGNFSFLQALTIAEIVFKVRTSFGCPETKPPDSFIHISYHSDGLTFAHRPYDSRPLDTFEKQVDCYWLQSFARMSFVDTSIQLVTKKVRHHDQDEREQNGSCHWETVRSVLLKAVW